MPSDIKRVFYLYDVQTEAARGAHAHKRLHQFLICLFGSFNVSLDDGTNRTPVHLKRPWNGLHILAVIWAAEVKFDPGSSSRCPSNAFLITYALYITVFLCITPAEHGYDFLRTDLLRWSAGFGFIVAVSAIHWQTTRLSWSVAVTYVGVSLWLAWVTLSREGRCIMIEVVSGLARRLAPRSLEEIGNVI